MRSLRLSRGLVALVDDADYPLVGCYKWYAKQMGCRGKFYVVRKTSRKNNPEHKQGMLFLHRVLLGLDRHDKSAVDHINGDTLDNRRCNLRYATWAQNNYNVGLRKDNTSGYKGVRLFRGGRRWAATIGYNGKNKHLGYFDTKEQAAEAYNKAALELFGAFARLNEIKDNK